MNSDAKNDEEDASPIASAASFNAGKELKPIALVPRILRGTVEDAVPTPTFKPMLGADRS